MKGNNSNTIWNFETKITDRWEIACGTRNLSELLIWDFNEYPDRAQFTQIT